jgi:hypothetical protein
MRHRVCAGHRCCARHINHSADVIKEHMNGFHEIADKVHHSCKADPATANGCADGCMGAPSSSATARQGIMRSADVCDSRALRHVLSASRCEGPADAAPQRDEPQPGSPVSSTRRWQTANVFHSDSGRFAYLPTAPGSAAARQVCQAARVGGCMCGGLAGPACAA